MAGSGLESRVDAYLDSLGAAAATMKPDHRSRVALALMAVPAVLFAAMPALVRVLSSLSLLLVPAAFAVHAVGLWLLGQGCAPDEARSAWRTWAVGLILGVGLSVSSLALGVPAGLDPSAAWGSAPSPGRAWLVVFALVPTAAIGATVQAAWAFADRFERLALSWAVVASVAALASLLVVGLVPGSAVPGPVAVLAGLGIGGPVLLVGLGRLLWRTRPRDRQVVVPGPVPRLRDRTRR